MKFDRHCVMDGHPFHPSLQLISRLLPRSSPTMDDLYSILPATRVPVHDLPKLGEAAPSFPADISNNPAIIIFLRHCGCPFSEKMFKQLRSVAGAYGDKIKYYAISHASKADVWINEEYPALFL